MITILPDAARSFRVPPLSEVDFEMFLEEVPVLLAGALDEVRDEGDAQVRALDGATIRYDAQVTATDLRAGTFATSDPARATVSADGYVTAAGSGSVGIIRSVPFLSRRVNHNARTETGASTRELLGYLAGTLARTATDALMAQATPTPDVSLFSTLNDAGAAYVRNGDVWTGSYDFSGVSPWNSRSNNGRRAGTLVSPRHVLMIDHESFYVQNGDTMRFVGADGTIHTRTLVSSTLVGSDTRVGVLNADVPSSVRFYPVMPANWRTHVKFMVDWNRGYIPTVWTNQDRHVHAHRLRRFFWIDQEMLGYGDIGFFGSLLESDPFYPAWRIPRLFDSGQPMFLPLPSNVLGLLSMWTTAGSGYDLSQNISAINAAMTTLGGGYQLTTVDLSAYPAF